MHGIYMQLRHTERPSDAVIHVCTGVRASRNCFAFGGSEQCEEHVAQPFRLGFLIKHRSCFKVIIAA